MNLMKLDYDTCDYSELEPTSDTDLELLMWGRNSVLSTFETEYYVAMNATNPTYLDNWLTLPAR